MPRNGYNHFLPRIHRKCCSSTTFAGFAGKLCQETGFQLTMEELRGTHAAKGAFLRQLAKTNL
jgi:hypothetical protein